MVAETIRAALAALGLDDATRLTQGGQKVVFRGKLNGADVIAKVVLVPSGPYASLVRERAHREVDLLAAVDSPYVVKVLTDAVEVGDQPDAVCWVEEWLDGEDLTAQLTRTWTDDEVGALVRDLATGLVACHDLEVVHRDLSPANIRVVPSGRFVIMDPGLARYLERTALTGMNQPGTLGFRSPEHVPGGDPTPASDVFGVGILAYYARTGQFPVDPSGSEADYFARLMIQIAPIRTVVPNIADGLAKTIDRCLQRQPARRYLDGRELLTAVEGYLGGAM